MSDIKNDVKNAIYFVFATILILIVFTTLFLGCGGDLTPIKSALSLIGNYVGAIATLAAAYIASLLFNDWRGEVGYKLIIQNREKLITNTLKLKDLFFTFYCYSNSEEKKDIEITYFKYLDCIWCLNDVKENLTNYIVVMKKFNLNKSDQLDLTQMENVLEELNKKYEQIKCNKDEMADPISVSNKMQRNTFQIVEIEKFCKGPAFEYEVNYLTKF